jgi:hypothetical protein
MNVKKKLFLGGLLLSLFCSILCTAVEKDDIEEKYPSNTKEYKLISLKNVSYDIVDRVCRPWLDKKSIMVHEKARNSILVYAEPETIVKIRKFIDQATTPEYNIRIDLERVGTQTDNDDKFTYRYNRPQPVVTYKNGKKIITYPHKKKRDPRLVLRSKRGRTDTRSLQFIVTQSGHPASLWVGKTVVDPSWLRNMLPKRHFIIWPDGYSVVTEAPDMADKMVDVGLSLQVLPRYLGNDLVEVEVYPEISKISGKGRNKAVKVNSLSTKITVRNGARVLIGGIVDQKQKEYKNLFGPDFFNRKGIGETMNMYIIATVMTPAESGRRTPFSNRLLP